MHPDRLLDRRAAVLDRIAAACARSGRDPSEVTLIAVSKTFPVDAIADLHALGQVDFGENKVQELVDKAGALPGQAEGGRIRWHMIGHLQRNKARDVVRHADVFHALDSERLARELERHCAAVGRRLPCLVQVNVSGEESKFGLDPDVVHGFIDRMAAYEHLDVLGLMTLASPADNPEDVRPQFRLLRQIARSCAGAGRRARLDVLSMGMSDDFDVAVEEGATHIRVGSAIFGPRDSH